MTANSDLSVCIGRVTGPFGVAGGVRVHPYTRSADLFESGALLTIQRSGGDEREFCVARAQAYKNIVRLWMEGVDDRDGAEALTGAEIYIPRSRLPETGPDTWYWCDLMGLEVYTTEGGLIGRVGSIIETGANDVLVVEDKGRETLVPVISSVVTEIDIDAGIIRVDLPEGI